MTKPKNSPAIDMAALAVLGLDPKEIEEKVRFWRWAIWWDPPATIREAFRIVPPSPSKAMGTRWWAGQHFGGWCVLPLVGCLSISTQPSTLQE